MKLIYRLGTGLLVLILFIVTFMVGANQHRINGWPFDRGYFVWTFGQPAFRGIPGTGDVDYKKRVTLAI